MLKKKKEREMYSKDLSGYDSDDEEDPDRFEPEYDEDIFKQVQ
jgi:hypothetical protein